MTIDNRQLINVRKTAGYHGWDEALKLNYSLKPLKASKSIVTVEEIEILLPLRGTTLTIIIYLSIQDVHNYILTGMCTHTHTHTHTNTVRTIYTHALT